MRISETLARTSIPEPDPTVMYQKSLRDQEEHPCFWMTASPSLLICHLLSISTRIAAAMMMALCMYKISLVLRSTSTSLLPASPQLPVF